MQSTKLSVKKPPPVAAKPKRQLPPVLPPKPKPKPMPTVAAKRKPVSTITTAKKETAVLNDSSMQYQLDTEKNETLLQIDPLVKESSSCDPVQKNESLVNITPPIKKNERLSAVSLPSKPSVDKETVLVPSKPSVNKKTVLISSKQSVKKETVLTPSNPSVDKETVLIPSKQSVDKETLEPIETPVHRESLLSLPIDSPAQTNETLVNRDHVEKNLLSSVSDSLVPSPTNEQPVNRETLEPSVTAVDEFVKQHDKEDGTNDGNNDTSDDSKSTELNDNVMMISPSSVSNNDKTNSNSIPSESNDIYQTPDIVSIPVNSGKISPVTNDMYKTPNVNTSTMETSDLYETPCDPNTNASTMDLYETPSGSQTNTNTMETSGVYETPDPVVSHTSCNDTPDLNSIPVSTTSENNDTYEIPGIIFKTDTTGTSPLKSSAHSSSIIIAPDSSPRRRPPPPPPTPKKSPNETIGSNIKKPNPPSPPPRLHRHVRSQSPETHIKVEQEKDINHTLPKMKQKKTRIIQSPSQNSDGKTDDSKTSDDNVTRESVHSDSVTRESVHSDSGSRDSLLTDNEQILSSVETNKRDNLLSNEIQEKEDDGYAHVMDWIRYQPQPRAKMNQPKPHVKQPQPHTGTLLYEEIKPIVSYTNVDTKRELIDEADDEYIDMTEFCTKPSFPHPHAHSQSPPPLPPARKTNKIQRAFSYQDHSTHHETPNSPVVIKHIETLHDEKGSQNLELTEEDEDDYIDMSSLDVQEPKNITSTDKCKDTKSAQSQDTGGDHTHETTVPSPPPPPSSNSTIQSSYQDDNVYESVDVLRPIPPPRRKRKTQRVVSSSSQRTYTETSLTRPKKPNKLQTSRSLDSPNNNDSSIDVNYVIMHKQ